MTNRITAARVTYGSRTLSASRASLLFGTALGVSIAIMAASPNQAWAADECGADVAGVAVCTSAGNPYPAGIDYVADAGEGITVVLDDTVDVITGTDPGVTASNANGDATGAAIVIDGGATVTAYGDGASAVVFAGTGDATIVNYGLVDSGVRGLFAYSAGGYAFVSNFGGTVDVDGSSNLTGFAVGVVVNGVDSGIYNNGTVTVAGDAGDLQVIGLYGYALDATFVNSQGAITVTGDAAIGAAGIQTYTGGASTVASGGAIDVTNTGPAAGISVNAGTTAVVTVEADIDVTSTAGDARGVAVYAADSASVTVTSDITAVGATSTYAIEIDNNVADAAATATVDVIGDLTATATSGFAEGVDVYSGGDVSIDVAGTISATSGAGAYGVFAVSYYGDVEVDVGDVNVTAVAGGAGVDVFALGFDGTGDATVTAGDITATGDGTEGVSADAINGSVTVDVGDVSTDGLYAEGIDAYAYLDVTVTAGAISTTGDGSEGVDAYSFSGDVNVSVVDVATAGYNSEGVYAYAFFGSTTVTSGSVNTLGDGSDGIYAYGFLGATVVSDSVTTAGLNSEGIEARSVFNAVSVDSGSVTTTGDLSTGILAFGYGGTTVVSDTVSTSGYASEGIVALDIIGPVSVTSGDVTTTGDYSNGIRAGSYYDVTVDSGTVSTSGDSSMGIEAYSIGNALGDGSVDVTFDSVVTDGGALLLATVPYAGGFFYYYDTPSHGIVATAGTGDVSVVGGDVTTNGLGASGIIASGFGDVYVFVDDVTTTGGALLYYDGPAYTVYYTSVGIDASVTGGDVTVIADTVTTSGYGAAGIVAVGNAYYDSLGTPTFYGDTLVVANDVVTNGDFADGIVASNSGGNTTVYVDTVTTFGEGSDGIIAVATGYYDSLGVQVLYGDVVVEANSVTTYGDDAYGVYAATASGDVFVDVGSVTTTGDGAIGIYAAAFNYYDSSLGAEQNLHGDVFVDAGSVSTGGDFATGIYGYAEGGNVNIDAGVVVTSGDFSPGIVATAAYYGPDPVLFTYYSGDANVTAGSVSTYGDFSDGINAFAEGGNVRIYAGSVYTGGIGSSAIVATTGGLDVNNSNDIYIETTGAIYSYDGVGISADSAGGVVVDVDSGSVYGYNWGIQSYSVLGTYIDNDGYVYGGEGRAIDVDGAAATIFNGGVILGFMDLTDNADYVYNNGLWEAYGTSDFGLGADLVVNVATVGFSRYNGGSQTTTFAGLEYFDNYGSVSGVDQQVGDSLVIPGNFFGGAGSELDIDVELGGPGSIADTLVIGSASGVTSVDPNDVLAGTPGALNFGGILVVDSANAAETGAEFVMDNVDKGFVEYELFFDAANDDWLIVGLPDHEAFEMLGAMSGAQDFWRRSGDALTARWQEVRDASPGGSMAAGPGGMGRSDGWELWMQAHAGVDGYDNPQVFSVGGFTFAEDLSTTTDWRGFQFGFDNMSGNTIWGLTMGFTQQETNFDATSNSFDFEGWNVGAYGGWASNGFFLNGLVKGDFYEVDGNFHTLPSLFSFDGVTWGAMGEIGYRWEGSSMFFEPVAQLAWTTTDLDRVTTSGATIDFDDADSLRAKAGARIGGTFGSGDIVLTPYIGVYWVDELEGENGLTFATGPTSFTIDDTAREDHGQVDFGFTTQTFYGLEGFVKGEWNFGGDADGGGVRMGARWRW